jgi:hypothetical protein
MICLALNFLLKRVFPLVGVAEANKKKVPVKNKHKNKYGNAE